MTGVLASLASPLDAGQLAGLFWHFFILSFFAIGGVITTAPGMHRYVAVEHHWIGDAQFSASIAIAQAAPGPNVLFVAVIGWTVAGPLGAMATMTGIMLPSTVLSLVASRWGARRRETRAMRSFTTGMTPITIGLLVATGWILAQPYLSVPAHRVGAVALIAITCFTMLRTRLSPMWLVALGAVLGALGWV